jgi:S-formylglutathione hydrolase FrmB
MALISCDFYSDVLKVGTSMRVILPDETQTQIGMTGAVTGQVGVPVLYLLHGLSDDHTSWQRRTSIERYVAPLRMAVVMPAVHRSLYADELHGHAYWTFLSKELPQLVSAFFRVSDRPQDTFVAGHSMGGYGALKWALREPSRFGAAASMSGGLDIAGLARLPERRELFERVFGEAPGQQNDLFALLRSVDIDALPPLHISCGNEDQHFNANQAFAQVAKETGVDLTVDFRPGEHEWGFWDTEIQKILAWLPNVSH